MIKDKSISELVSVIIPTYNREVYIGYAIRSIIDDSYSKKEIIVVDDGSTDRTRELIIKIAESTEVPIRYVYQRNSGGGRARNIGMSIAEGEYLLFLDSDDFLIDDKIAKSIAAFAEYPKLQVVYSDWYIQDKNGIRQKGTAHHEFIRNIVKGEFHSFTFGMQTTAPLWKKSFLSDYDLFWSEELSCWQESVLTFRALLRLVSLDQILHIEEPLYVIVYEGQERMGDRFFSEEYILSQLCALDIIYIECKKYGVEKGIIPQYKDFLKELLYRSLVSKSKAAWKESLCALSKLYETLLSNLIQVTPFEFAYFVRWSAITFRNMLRKTNLEI